MRKDKIRAYELRRKGKSYSEIQKALGVSKGTLSGWFKGQDWSDEIKKQLSSEASLVNPITRKRIAKTQKERWQRRYQEYRQEATQGFSKLKNSPLFLAGLMLYWGEGDTQAKYSVVRLANSDPEMIRIFFMFLTKSIGIDEEKISVWLLLYPDLVDPVQKNFWSKSTGIPLERFKKSTYIKGRHPTKRLSYGVCTIFVQSRALKERMLKWLELTQDYLRSYSLSIENK